ncbi:4Fe-4S binding protein [Lachnospiraceae bacterium 62-35]
MIRKIIKIDEEKCTGCGACAEACHEGAIKMINGKAKLIREDYCDGLGDCLPECPYDAITFEEREAAAYDPIAVLAARQGERKEAEAQAMGCPGMQMRQMTHRETENAIPASEAANSQLGQWPCQIKLVPLTAPYFHDAKLLIAADCTAYAYADIHRDFMKGRITLIGCPKLDSVDYGEKLVEIIKNNNIKSITVLRMEVPCCGGLETAVRKALKGSGKLIPWQVVTVSIDGKIIED